MNDLTNIPSILTQNIILKDISKLIIECKEQKGFKNIVKYIILNCPLFFLLISIEYLTKNPKELFIFLKNKLVFILDKIFFRYYIFHDENSELKNSILTKINEFRYVKHIRTTSVDKLRYIPLISNFNKIYNESKKNIELSSLKIKTTKSIFDTDKNIYVRLYSEELYFPTQNNIMIEKIIRDNIENDKLFKRFTVTPIIIDGPPGIGKTYTFDYISSLDIISKCYYVRMNSFIDRDFDTILKDIVVFNNQTALLLIDELDKYVYYHIKHKYFSYLNKCEKKNELPVNLLEFSNNIKNKVIESLNELMDSRKVKNSFFILFCSNNFKTIFDGVNVVHIESFFDRLINIKYSLCDKEELERYLIFNNKIHEKYGKGVDEYLIKEKIKEMDEFQISYRYLNHISKIYCNNHNDIINCIKNKNYKSFDYDLSLSTDKLDTDIHYKNIVKKIKKNKKYKNKKSFTFNKNINGRDHDEHEHDGYDYDEHEHDGYEDEIHEDDEDLRSDIDEEEIHEDDIDKDDEDFESGDYEDNNKDKENNSDFKVNKNIINHDNNNEDYINSNINKNFDLYYKYNIECPNEDNYITDPLSGLKGYYILYDYDDKIGEIKPAFYAKLLEILTRKCLQKDLKLEYKILLFLRVVNCILYLGKNKVFSSDESTLLRTTKDKLLSFSNDVNDSLKNILLKKLQEINNLMDDNL